MGVVVEAWSCWHPDQGESVVVARNAWYSGWLWEWLAAEACWCVCAGSSASNSPGVKDELRVGGVVRNDRDMPACYDDCVVGWVLWHSGSRSAIVCYLTVSAVSGHSCGVGSAEFAPSPESKGPTSATGRWDVAVYGERDLPLLVPSTIGMRERGHRYS